MKKIGAILLVAAMVIMMMPISVSAAWEASKNAYAYTSSDVSNTIVGGDSIADLTTTGLDTIYVSAAETLAAAPQDNTTYIVDGVALTLADAAIPTGTKFVTINGGTVVVPNAQSPISSTVTTTGNVTLSYGDSTATVDKASDADTFVGSLGTVTGLAAGAPTKAVLADAATLNGTIDFDIDAGANKLTTGSAVTINAGKTVKTTGELEVATGHSLTNSGSLDVGTLTLTGTMDNQGTITAATAIAVNADGSTNSGNITGAGAMTIAANTTLATTDGEISIATLSFTDNTSILNRSGDATITSATINLNGADEGTVLPGGKAPATQPPVTPPTTTGPSYQIVWGNGGSNSTELWAKPSTSNPTGSDEWAKPSTDSNKTNPSMGGAR